MKKRIISMLLAIVMVIGVLPVTAGAASLPVSSGQVDITDKVIGPYTLQSLSVYKQTSFEAVSIVSAEQNDTTIDIVLAGDTDPSAALQAGFVGSGQGTLNQSGNKCVLVDGSGSMSLAVAVRMGNQLLTGPTYTINFTVEGSGGPSIKFESNLSDAEVKYIKNAVADPLTVTAAHSEGAEVSYQWYSNTANSTEGGTVITGETDTSYTPSTAVYGTMYYYVVASAEGVDPATSKIAKITVQEPYITFDTNPQSAEYTKGDTAEALTVAATQSEGTEVEYQWYSNSANNTTGGTAIEGATGTSYTPPAAAECTTYYYAVAASLDKNGEKNLTLASSAAKITVKLPVVSFSGTTGGSALYLLNAENVTALEISASQNRGGEVNYQWYQNDNSSNTGGTAIEGATGASYTPSVSAAGTSYYYVIASAEDSTPATSGVYTVTVREMGVEFTTNLSTTMVEKFVGDSLTLSVAAKPTVPDAMADWESKLSYQWYSNAENSTVGGTAIEGATSASYDIPTAAAGTTYYYVVAMLDGNYTATSTVATVNVSEKPSLPVTDNVIDIEDLTVYERKNIATAKVINIKIVGADVEKATQDNNTSVDIVLDGSTADDAEISVEFGHSGSSYTMSGHTGAVTLENGKAQLVMTLKGGYKSIASWSGTKTYTLNFSLGAPPTVPPTRLQETDSASTYTGVAVDFDLKDYFKAAKTYYLVEEEEKTPLDGSTYTFKTFTGGTHTLTFAASNDNGFCSDYVTVTVEVTEIKSGAWLGINTSNGSMNYVRFKDAESNEIDGLTASLEGNVIKVSVPRSYAADGKITAVFDLTQNNGLPFITTKTGASGTSSDKAVNNKFTEKTTSLSQGAAKFTFYLYNSNPSATSNSYTTYTIEYAIQNEVPVLAENQPAAGTASITADQSYTLDLDGIFVDPDAGDSITGWKVSANGAAAVNAEVDAESVYSWKTDAAGEYTLKFYALDNYGAASSETYTVTVMVGNAATTYDVTVNVPDGVSPTFYWSKDAEDGKTLAAEKNGNVYTVKVPTNVNVLAWRADGIGMDCAVKADDVLTLVKPTFIVKAGEETDSEASVVVTHGSGTVIGSGNSYLLLAGDGYTFKATPGGTYAGSFKETVLANQTVTGGETIINLSTKAIPITVPYGWNVTVRPDSQSQESIQAKIPADKTEQMMNPPATVYYFTLTNNKAYEYRVTRDGYASYIGTFKKTDDTAITVTQAQITEHGNAATLDRDLSVRKGTNVSDVLLNVNPQGHLKLAVNDTFQIRPLRNWWGSNHTWTADGTKYLLVEPEYHYTVVGLDGQISNDVVSVDEDGKVTAKAAGTAIVLVTYDAMTVNFHEYGGDVTSGFNPNGFYGALWPENTGVFVVSVGAEASGITTGITLNEEENAKLKSDLDSVPGKSDSINGTSAKTGGAALDGELDVIYFIGDSGKYTFTPGTADVTVSVANPTVGDAMSFSGFESLTANDDGSVTVPLTEGRNIVRLEKDGKAEYQVITAKSVAVTVNGTPLAEATVAPGDTVSVKFTNLYNPVNRMAPYNTGTAVVYQSVSGTDQKAGNRRGDMGYYTFASSEHCQTVEHFVEETTHGGYKNTVVTDGVTANNLEGNRLTVPADFTEEIFTLSEGRFNVGGFAWFAFGGHRAETWPRPNSSPNVTAYYGRLPDISIPVAAPTGIEITTQPTKVTYHIGDSFDPAGMVVKVSYQKADGSTITNAITGYTWDTAPFTEAGTKEVTISYSGMTATVSVEVTDVTLDQLKVTTQPTKTLYYAGDSFDPAGMVVKAVYSDGTEREVTNYTCNPTILSVTDTKITVTYGGKTVDVPITISLIESLKITTPPTKTSYAAGEYFNPAGMVVTAVYSDGFEAAIEEYTFAPTGKLAKENTSVTITYSGSEGASTLQPVTLPITVAGEAPNPGTPMPEEQSITVYVSFVLDGQIVEGVDGTLLYDAPVTITNEDGEFTMSDAFKAFHEMYYRGGAGGYSDNGNLISDFWGQGMNGLAYTLNHKWVRGIYAEIDEGDRMAAFFHQDESGDYSDLYTYFEHERYTATANKQKTFTVTGLNVMNSSAGNAATAYPEGATVTVYSESGREISALNTTTDAKGQFAITFTGNGTYIVEVSGTCDYTYSGGYGSGTVTDAPVVPSRCTVSVSGGVVNAADQKAAEAAEKLIDQIGVVTKNSGDAIQAAREAYNELSEEQKLQVANYQKLIDAEKKYAELTGTLVFTDVSAQDYYFEAIKWAVEKGITNGTTDTTFSPAASCTRAQMVTFLWRAAGRPKAKTTACSFTDVAKDAYYYEALLWAVENGITTGTSATIFNPGVTCTRGQMATFLYRNAKSPAVSGSHAFTDVKDRAYYNDAVVWAAKEGITNGTSKTTFSPDEKCTRGQMVTFLYRYLAK